jgi:hypothetical protein
MVVINCLDCFLFRNTSIRPGLVEMILSSWSEWAFINRNCAIELLKFAKIANINTVVILKNCILQIDHARMARNVPCKVRDIKLSVGI